MDGSFCGLASAGMGPVELRASIENPRVSLSDPEAWEALYGSGSRSDSGVSVTPTKALSHAAMWQGVGMISGDVARMPLDVYRRTQDGREVDKEHPAWWLVHEQPNDEQHAYRFWRTMVAWAILWGNGYAYIDRHPTTGRPLGLYPLLPDRTAPERDRETGALVYATEYRNRQGRPKLKALWPWEVYHIAGLSLDGTVGAMMIKHARQAIGLALARQKFESRFFRHGVRAGGILELPLGSGEKFQDNVTEGFRRHHEGEDNWFRTVILRDGVKFHQTSFNAQEAQLNEAGERGAREVARFLNLAPSRLGVEGSASYNSKHEDNQAYLDTTLSPWLTEIVHEAKSKLLTEDERRSTHYFEHNTAVMLSMDLLKRYQAYAIGIRNHWLTPNVVLAKENEEKVPWGDEPIPIPGAKSDGGADKGENDKPRGTAKDGEESEGTRDVDWTPAELAQLRDECERRRLERRIVFRLADHARAKARKGHRAFGEWLAGGLATHRQEALDLLGDSTPVDRCLKRLEGLLEAPVSELHSRVESIAAELEREH